MYIMFCSPILGGNKDIIKTLIYVNINVEREIHKVLQ